MDNSFLDVRTVYSRMPELKRYIPHNVSRVGISSSGNLKYMGDDNHVNIIPKDRFPPDLRRRLRNIYEKPNAKKVVSTRPKISDIDYKKFDFDVPCPNATELYISDQFLTYVRLTKKHQRWIESPLEGTHKQTKTVIKDIVLNYVGKKISINQINAQISRNYNMINENRADFIYYFYEKSAHLANVSIEIEKPCAYFTISTNSMSYHADTMFRMDQDFTKPEILIWLDERAKKIITKRNDEARNDIEKYYVHQSENALQNLFKNNGYEVKLTSKLNKGKTNYKTSVECKRNDVVISLDFTNTYVFESDFLIEEYTELGLLNVTLSKKGKEKIIEETKKLYKQLCERNWKIDITGKLLNEVNHSVSECNHVCNPLINGHLHPKDLTYSYDIKKHVLKCENSFFEFIQKDDNKSIKYTELYKKLQHETELKRYQQACEYLKKCLEEKSITLTYTNGDGMLYGKTEVAWHYDHTGADYIWNSPSYKDSLIEWKKAVDQNVNDILIAIKKKLTEEEQEFRRRFGGLIDSFIARDAAIFVKKNEEYITENAAIHFLRGLANTFGGNITETDAGGRYKPISSDEVEDIIDSMIYKGLIRTVTYKGTYGKFDILKTTSDLDNFINLKHGKKSEKELLKLSLYNDYDAQNMYTILTSKEELGVPDYMQLLKLIPAKGFVCRNYTTFIDTFKKAPDMVKNYLKMKKEMTEDNYEKKLIIQMLKK